MLEAGFEEFNQIMYLLQIVKLVLKAAVSLWRIWDRIKYLDIFRNDTQPIVGTIKTH